MASSADRGSTHTVDSERRHIDDNDLTVTVRMNLDKANVPDDEVATRKDEEVGEKMSESLERITTVPTRMDEASIIEPPENIFETIPDGGYGWAIAVAGFLSNFVMFGSASIWGVFSEAFANGVLKGKATTIQLMGVGSVANACMNAFTPLSTLLTAKLGARLTFAMGSVLMCLGIILCGFSHEVWHVYLTQGLLYGIGASWIYMSVISVIPQWFTTRRGTAMGISSAGTGLGGLALAPMARSLIDKYDLPWAYRIIGLMSVGVCAVSAAMLQERLPKGYRQKAKFKSPIKLSTFKIVDFNIWLVGAVIALTGYLSPLFFVPKYAVHIGLSETDSANLLSILCAFNAIGRIVFGFIADRIGRLNTYCIASTLAGLFCFVIWPFANSFGVMVAFVVLWGFTCGIYYALAAPITGGIVGMEEMSSAFAILFLVSSISSVGPPIASAIQMATPGGGYIGIQMFCGALYVCGAFICFGLKIKRTKSVFSVL
ncbi:major facilitator superfamily domain-containing protein [Syncephalastrum racemosum]|uniref:Major facilitator superfamily domain-containing protein n=1 Tax=Syncephalastrum racemosum TaxID=13706 RepID=A0A1X2H9Q9_SYNRA|nr:major facilitator superfamily domain-containing protein [Syncephalastrum racemosum]